MNKINFKYPILAFSSTILYTARDEKDILICTKTALNKGFYRKMLIIDSDGLSYHIKDAKKIKGHGMFWGYNIFLNQKIEVELILEKQDSKEVSIEELKEKVIINLQRGFWDAGGNAKEIIKEVKLKQSINDLIVYLSDLYFN